MIETLGTATLTEIGAGGRTAGYDLVLTGITFQDGDLSRPLYPTLFDYERAPQGVRFEPGVQILKAEPLPRFLFLFQLQEGAGVSFLTDSAGQPIVLSVTDPNADSVPGLTATLLDPLTCELTWDQAAADLAHGGMVKVTALRLVCELLEREPTNPEVVDGGLYLAIVNRHEEAGPDLGIGDSGDPEPHTVKMLGTDAFGRPVYDLFLPEPQALLPLHLGLEPAIRVREREKADVAIQIATLPGIDLRFDRATGNPEEVQVHGFEPRGWPPQLRSATRQDFGKRCQLLWIEETGRNACTIGNPEQNKNYCLNGQIASFYLEASLQDGFFLLSLDEDEVEMWRARGVRMQLDPTVIQPPSCTGGICI
jgi:hypothetical protein